MSIKKRVTSAVMLSTVLLSASAGLTSVSADTTDDKIQQQENKIANAKSDKEKAQAQIDAVQAKVDALKEKQDAATQKLKDLAKESQATNSKIKKLNEDIAKRTDSLEAQARSAQVNNSATSYIDAVVNSSSLTDAIQKLTAMATVSSANKNMIDQQKADEKELQEKLDENTKKYDEASKLQVELAGQGKELTAQQAQLKVAQLNYQATITSAEGEKASLLKQKAEAEAAAKALAEAQKAEAEKIANAQANNTALGGNDITINSPVNNTTNNNNNNNNQNQNQNQNQNDQGNTGGGNTSNGGSSVGNPYPWGQCTWGVWQILGGNMPKYGGNAADWAYDPQAVKASGPAVGEIVVFPSGNQGAGGYGHVAVVTGVNADGTFRIAETNYGATDGIIKYRDNVSSVGVTFLIP